MKIKTIITLAVSLVLTAFAIAQPAPPVTPPAAPPVDSTTAVKVGQAVELAVTVDGTAPFSYQWKKNGTNISTNATGSKYAIAAVSTTSAGDYTVTVSNSAGSTTSPKATLVVNLPTVITAQPKALSALTGTAAKFTVTATGTGLTFQWQKDGVNVADTNASAKTASLTIPVVAPSDAALYTVIVTGAAGPVTSSPAPLVVIQVTLPTITSFTTTVK